MGCIRNCACWHINHRQLIIPLIFLLILSLTNARFMVEEGRAISKLVRSASPLDYPPTGKEVVAVAVARRLIGSRPPSCERRCRSCGHCEAIQVPVVTKIKSHATHNYHGFSATPSVVASSRGDDISNYKPISWKCKCGDFIFNP